MELGELVSLYRRQAGMTIDELVEKSGVPKGTITKIIGGTTKAPTLENMKAIAKALNKKLADFDDEPEIEIFLSPDEKEFLEKYNKLDPYGKESINIMMNRELNRIEQMNNQKEPAPIIIEVFPTRRYLQSASAGYGNFNDDSSYEMMDLVKRPPVGTSFIISVNGDSMEPTYSDGTLLFVKAQERVDVGQIGLFVKAGNLYIKEFGRDGLISHNKNGNYPLIYSEIDSPIITQGRIIGVCSDDYLQKDNL